MRHICKRISQEASSALRNWVRNQPIDEVGNRVNCRFDDMPSTVKRTIKSSLLAEQGGLCCYTGIAISDEESHIEHFKPQNLCKDNEDIEYNNLLAAYPRGGQCSFGAHAKGGHYDSRLINPIHDGCESLFQFSMRGDVAGTNEMAQRTIDALCLDHPKLRDLRLRAIKTACYRKNKMKSDAQLKRIAENYCERVDEHFHPFCFVIAQAAQQLLEKRQRVRHG